MHSCIVMPLCVVVLTYNSTPLYDCSQPQQFGIFGFPSLKNCSHGMLQQKATVTTFHGEVV